MVALLKIPVEAGQDHTERRLFPRRPIRLSVDALRLDHSVEARRQPCVRFELENISAGGVLAFSESPLSPGERLNVHFPTSSQHMGWDAYGRVVRCQPGALGYKVAVEFDLLPAA